MLQSIRDTAQGWIAWVIIILISIPFALWGIQEYLGVGGEPVVANVDGQEITDYELSERVRIARENLRASLGDSYRPDLFPEATLRRQVLDQVIEERVLFQGAQDMGLAVSDEAVRRFILSQQGFQQDGRFDSAVYENTLRNRGMSTAGYEQLVRQDLLLRQFSDAVESSSFVTVTELAAYSRLQDQRRKLAYVVIPASSFMEAVDPSDEDLTAYYREHAAAYMQPERVKLDYLLLDLASIGEQIEVDEAQLQAYFEEHRAEFANTGETQAVDFAAVRERVVQAYRRAEAEHLFYDFSERLANISYEQPDSLVPAAENLGLSIKHSDWLDRRGGAGDLSSPKVTDAAFSEEVLAEGRNSEVIELGANSLLVLRVQAHEEAQQRPLAEVRDTVLQAYKREQAEKQALAAGEAALSRLREGAGLAGLAEESGWSVIDGGEVGRDDLALPQEVLDQTFALPRPSEGQSQYGGSPLASGDYALVAVSGVKDGELKDETARRLLANQLQSSQGRSEYGHFVAVLRAGADVSLVESD